MLFNILDLRVFADIEGMNAVMLAVAATAIMDAAARHDGYLRTLSDKEVVINHIMKAALGQNDRNMDGFVLCTRRNADIDAVLIRFGFDYDMLGITAKCLFTVGTDIDGAFAGSLHIRNDGKDLFLNFIQHF